MPVMGLGLLLDRTGQKTGKKLLPQQYMQYLYWCALISVLTKSLNHNDVMASLALLNLFVQALID